MGNLLKISFEKRWVRGFRFWQTALTRLVWGGVCLLVGINTSSSHAQTKKFQSRPFFQEIQQTLDALARAEIAREEATLVGKQHGELDAIRKQCRQAILQLRSLETSLAELLRKSYQTRPSQRDANEWTTRELESLRRNLKVELARAYRNQALCYADASPDRMNALNIALKHLQDVIAQPLNESSVWRGRVEQIICLRLLKKNDVVREELERWRAGAPPKKITARFFGEELLLDLSEGEVERAWALATDQFAKKQARGDDVVLVPQRDDAVFQVLLAMRRQSSAAQATEFTRRATEQLQYIAITHGPYWRRRAEVYFGRALAERLDTDDPQLLAYAAASQYASGNLSAAIKTYDRIAALQTDDVGRQFQTQKTVAAIVRQNKQTTDALTRFRKLALQYPQHEEAASMHLIAIGQAAKISRTAPAEKQGETFERYHALLKEHLLHWPQAPSAKKVRTWLDRSQLPDVEQQRAQILTKLGDNQKSIALYRKLLADAPNSGKLTEALATQLAKSTDTAEQREALNLWRQIEKRSKPGGLRWWRGRRARLQLLQSLGEGGKAKQLRQLTKLLYPQAADSN